MKQYLKFNIGRCVLALALVWLTSVGVVAQGRLSVSGKVVDQAGLPLVGATVVEQGTTNGTTTGVDGNYTLSVKNNKSELNFSSLGYTSQTFPVGANSKVNVTMAEDAINMNEVVVTGYGRTVTKDKLTAAISKVSSDVFDKGVRANPLQALAGTVTGVRVATTSGRPGAAPEIIIRGGAALDGTGKPLYVVDGVQREDMNDINSNDIESLEILKDAAATALYGAKANAGVLLVTTKRGRMGKSQIDFKANLGLNYMRKTNEFLAADDYLYYLRMAAYRSGNTASLSASGPYGTGNIYTADGNKTPEGVYSTMFLSEDNRFLLGQGYKTMVDPITGKTIIYNNFSPREDSVRDMAVTQEYNVSASGGNDRGRYFASLGYYDEAGFPLVSSYNRLTLTTNASYKVTPWLESSSAFNFSRSNSNQVTDYRSQGEAEFFGVMFSAPPTMRRTNLDGDLIAPTTGWATGNWLATKDNFFRRNTNYRFTMNQGLKFSITDHISLKVNGMWYFNLAETEKFNRTYITKPGTYDTTRAASAGYSRMLSQTYNAIAGYENSWSDHNLSVIAGYEFYDKFNFGFSASGQGADSDDFFGIGNFDKTDPKNIAAIGMNSSHVRERSMSVFGNASYDYQGKYLFSFSARYDGYSKLVNNKWGFFPGVSAAWNMHKEKFMDGSRGWLSSLKIRAGYGQNGNVNLGNLGPYDLLGNYGKTGAYDGDYGILINKLPYPDLRWEKTTSVDLAVEASFWSRVRVSLGAYNKHTTDLLASVPFPSSAGVGNQTTNNGSVRNRGLEFEVDATLLQNKDWKIQLGVNATYMRSKILALPENGNANNRQGGQQVYNAAGDLVWVGGYQQGQEFGVAYAYQMVDIVRSEADLQQYGWYVDTTPKRPIYGPAAWSTLTAAEQQKAQLLQPGDAVFYDVNGDKMIDQYDQVKMGNTIPRWVGGVNLSATWKSLSLTARFDYATGYVAANTRKQWYMGIEQGTFNTLKEAKDTWSEQRPDAKYPILMYADSQNRNNFRMSNIYYDDSSYFSAREITMSYSLPQKWARMIRMQNLQVSMTGQNLFYWTSSSLYNPEFGSDGQGGYSIPKMVIFGIKATF